MLRRPTRSTRTDTLFPSPARFRSVPRRNALAQAAAGAGLPAVRRTDAAAHGQERRVLVLFALPGLQGRVADRVPDGPAQRTAQAVRCRSEEHTSELQSLMRISYAVFCLKKKHIQRYTTT